MILIKNIRRFYFFISFISISQLLHRFKLIIKRKFLVLFFKKLNFVKTASISLKRKNKVINIWKNNNIKYYHKEKNGFIFNFLNKKISFEDNFNWHQNILKKGTRLWLLNLHYFHWIENSANKDFYFFINDWINKNRPYQKGYWLDSWNSYALSIRVVVWISELSKREDELEQGFLKKVEESIAYQIQFLMKNLELDIGGNHLIKNIKALLYGSQFFKGALAESWGKKAKSLLKIELNKQILDDGFHFELSPAYHCQVFEDLIDCYSVLEDSKLKIKLKKKLSLMAIVVESFTHADNKISLFNDGGLDMARNPLNLLATYKNKLTGLTLQKSYYSEFKNSGYYVIKNNFFHLIYKSGNAGSNHLPAHAHGDIFSFELSVKNQRFIIDQGVFEYDPGTFRNLSRATISHNTVTVNDENQCEFFSSFRMGQRATVEINNLKSTKESLYIASSHNGYRHLIKSPIHRRELSCSYEGNITIIDKIIGGDNQNINSRLLIHPDIKLENINDHVIALKGESNTVLIEHNKLTAHIEPAFWWPNFGESIKTKRINFYCGSAPCEAKIKILMEKADN